MWPSLVSGNTDAISWLDKKHGPGPLCNRAVQVTKPMAERKTPWVRSVEIPLCKAISQADTERVCTESWLWEEHPLLHRGIEPASAAWRSDVLTNWATSHPNLSSNCQGSFYWRGQKHTSPPCFSPFFERQDIQAGLPAGQGDTGWCYAWVEPKLNPGLLLWGTEHQPVTVRVRTLPDKETQYSTTPGLSQNRTQDLRCEEQNTSQWLTGREALSHSTTTS